MFHNSRNVQITGGNFTVNIENRNLAIIGGNFGATSGNTAFEKLQNACAPNAFHDSSARFDPPKCHPNTRVAILDYLMGWIFGRNDPEALILWLYGPAGAGKSAILQTIAERCFDGGTLLASFFFGRSDPTRNTFKPLIATIAHQIATAIPQIKPVLERIIERDPFIFDKSIANQVQSLIVEPLKDLTASGFFNDPRNRTRLLILIDGLDECQEPRMQSMIIRALTDALRNEKLPLIFLIASRPEQHITLTFNSSPITGLWRSLVLDALFRPDNDIHLFLEESFREMKAENPYRRFIPETWPEPSVVDSLVRKSSGQFIYASAVVKYVSVPVDLPSRRLDVVMGLRPARGDVPFAELDALYTHILGSCTNRATVLSILGLVISKITQNVNDIEMYLDLEPGEAEIALGPLTSIIRVSDPRFSYGHQWIELWHASLSDFLVDISRSGPFYINKISVKEHFLMKCIQKLMNPHSMTLYDQSGRRILDVLSFPLQWSFYDVSLTATLANALMGFSLPQLWSIWSTEPPGQPLVSLRTKLVFRFLEFLSGHPDFFDGAKVDFGPERLGFSTFYALHLSSFELIILSEVPKYYQDVGLTALLVVSILGKYDYFLDENRRLLLYNTAVKPLFRLTDDASKFDSNSLCLESSIVHNLIVTHYRYLFVGPRQWAEVSPDGNKYTQVALRILEYLCDHPPHPIPYKRRQTQRLLPYRTGTFTATDQRSPLKTIQRMRMTGNNFLRKRREEKHRYGVRLSVPAVSASHPTIDIKSIPIYDICEWGLLLLPDIFDMSPYSPELAVFIRRHGSNIVFLPKTTRKAIRAMHEYLDRSYEVEVANMVG